MKRRECIGLCGYFGWLGAFRFMTFMNLVMGDSWRSIVEVFATLGILAHLALPASLWSLTKDRIAEAGSRSLLGAGLLLAVTYFGMRFAFDSTTRLDEIFPWAILSIFLELAVVFLLVINLCRRAGFGKIGDSFKGIVKPKFVLSCWAVYMVLQLELVRRMTTKPGGSSLDDSMWLLMMNLSTTIVALAAFVSIYQFLSQYYDRCQKPIHT